MAIVGERAAPLELSAGEHVPDVGPLVLWKTFVSSASVTEAAVRSGVAWHAGSAAAARHYITRYSTSSAVAVGNVGAGDVAVRAAVTATAVACAATHAITGDGSDVLLTSAVSSDGAGRGFTGGA